jgi:hypothetical protein
VATARQRANDHLIGLMKIAQQGPGDMTQPTRDAMAFDGRTHRLADDQSEARTRAAFMATPPPDVDNDVGLRRAHPVLHRGVKL